MVAIDPQIHAPTRLQLVTTLAAVSEAEFATLRDALEVSDSVLSKHVSALVDVGYLRSRKSSHAGPADDVDRAHRPRPACPARPRGGAARPDRRRGLSRPVAGERPGAGEPAGLD